MIKYLIALETSYLLELYKVPGKWIEADATEIISRYRRGAKEGFGFFLPITCIYEFANHLAHVSNTQEKLNIATRFLVDLKSSIEDESPWTVVPYKEIKYLPALFQNFISVYLPSGIGFTDASVAYEANRLKEKYRSFGEYKIHIWTKDRELKSREPDPEENAFLGH